MFKNIFLLIYVLFVSSLHAQVILTQEEKEFIQNTTVQCATTSTWAPFNIKKSNDQLYGLGLDYISLIQKHTGLNIQCSEYEKWSDVIGALKTKQTDMTIATSTSDKKKEYSKFTKAYLSYPIAIATTIDKVFISSGAYLENKNVAVGKGYSSQAILKQKYSKIKFIETNNIDEALLLLSQGKVEAVVDILPVLSYNITKLRFANLKIAGTTQLNFDVRMMIRDDDAYAPLLGILNKGIDAITLEEKSTISNKWVSVKFNQAIDYKLLFLIGAPLFLILLYFIYSNSKLNREIKLRKKIQKQLEHQVNVDPLTQVYNRRYLKQTAIELIAMAQRYKEELSLITIDADHFKKINDTHGHSIGDKVLKVLSSKLLELTRPSDIVVRLGGEEFVVILPKTPVAGAQIVAQKIRKGVQEIKVALANGDICQLTVSLGVTSYNANEDKNIENTIHRADLALYEAKKNGRNQSVTFR